MNKEFKEMFWGIVTAVIEAGICGLVAALCKIPLHEAMLTVLFADYFYTKGRKFWDEINKMEK